VIVAAEPRSRGHACPTSSAPSRWSRSSRDAPREAPKGSAWSEVLR